MWLCVCRSEKNADDEMSAEISTLFEEMQDAIMILVSRENSEERVQTLKKFNAAVGKSSEIGVRLSIWKTLVEDVLESEALYRGNQHTNTHTNTHTLSFLTHIHIRASMQ